MNKIIIKILTKSSKGLGFSKKLKTAINLKAIFCFFIETFSTLKFIISR